LGIGDWGLAPTPNPQSPIPNPPIPNPQSPIPIINENGNSEIINYINKNEVNILEKNNSFTLLNGNNYIEENISFPTLDELEREDNLEKNASYYK